MRRYPIFVALAIMLTTLGSLPTEGHAQVDRLRRAARRATTDALTRRAERLLTDAIRCSIADIGCANDASSGDKDVIYTDANGDVIVDDDGVPITDREEAAAKSGVDLSEETAAEESAMPRPGEGAWANYDFVPGDRILFYDDYGDDVVGDFPRRLELVEGNWEVIEWEGSRYVRATSGGMLAIPLPETLPDRFTIEYGVSVQHGNAYVRMTPGRAYQGPARDYAGTATSVELNEAGIRRVKDVGPQGLRSFDRTLVTDSVAPIRIMMDEAYMKMYLGETRVANAPNAVFPRSDTLFLSVGSASENSPILIGPIRIASGGRDLYDRLERDGRVATQGILFATNSDRIRPESTPTLKEIGGMLQDHPELRISIEGHTDHDGEEAYNLDLSERRAAAVKAFIAQEYGIDGGRLETAGHGESRPIAGNDTPEGRQQNRRVELVRLGESG